MVSDYLVLFLPSSRFLCALCGSIVFVFFDLFAFTAQLAYSIFDA